MKKLLFLLILVGLILLNGCENRKFTQIVTHDIDDSFIKDVNGTLLIGPMTISRADITRELSLPDEHRVIKVNIEASRLRVSETDLSAATSVDVEGYFVRPNGRLQIIPKISLPLNTGSYFIVNRYVDNNMAVFVQELSSILLNPEDSRTLKLDFQVTPDAALQLKLDIEFRISIEYEFCQEVITILSEDGTECDL